MKETFKTSNFKFLSMMFCFLALNFYKKVPPVLFYDKICLIKLSFRHFSKWGGKEVPTNFKIQNFDDKAHEIGQKVSEICLDTCSVSMDQGVHLHQLIFGPSKAIFIQEI
jgi:hypothetical protein